jgi:hypothetical protein
MLVPRKCIATNRPKLLFLTKGKKTSKEQENTAMQTSPPNQLIIGVGNNDLEKKDTSTCVSEMQMSLYNAH